MTCAISKVAEIIGHSKEYAREKGRNWMDFFP
jgi:hypothetical protein